jgi:hypothetical protein
MGNWVKEVSIKRRGIRWEVQIIEEYGEPGNYRESTSGKVINGGNLLDALDDLRCSLACKTSETLRANRRRQ